MMPARRLAMVGLIRARDGGRIIRRRRRRRHIASRRLVNILPPKPRKPPSAFNLFVRDYFRTAMARNFHTAPAVMPYAGQIWRNNPAQRQRYEIQARPELVRYQRAYADYQAKKVLLKRPGNGFIHFAKDLWRRQGHGRSISDMAKLGSRMWRNMHPRDRGPFIEQARTAKQAYNEMLHRLNTGQARLEDYMPRQNAQTGTGGQTTPGGEGHAPDGGQGHAPD